MQSGSFFFIKQQRLTLLETDTDHFKNNRVKDRRSLRSVLNLYCVDSAVNKLSKAMAGSTCILSLACALLVTTSHAQMPGGGGGGGGIPPSLMSMINTMTSGNNNQAFSPQLSLVESFGPINSQTISTGTQTGSSPFNQQPPPQNPPPQPPPTFQQQMPSQMTSQMQPQVTSQQMTSQLQPQVISQIQRIMSQMPMSSFMAPSMPSLQQAQPTGTGSPSNPGAGLAQFFGNGAASSSAGPSSNYISSGAAASKPLGNDILSQVTAFVNQGPPPLNPSSGRPGSMGGIPPMPPMGQGGIPPMPPMGGGMGLPALPPMSVLGSLMPGMLNPASMRNTAMLRMGRRIGSQFGVNQYYEMHGCADPTTLFTGRQRAMATMAMAQGCQSYQATRICKMAQVKERTGSSMLTSRFLPPQIRSRLEGCLSAKVLFSSMSMRSPLPVMGTGMGAGLLPTRTSGAPSLRECGMLLSTVMDGGSLDPESMIATRRSMLPWSCNESNLGGNGIPYRVCCPGKVHEPTLQEASMLKSMMGA